MVLSTSMMVAGFGAMAVLKPDRPGLGIGLSFLGGFGTGGIIQPAATILMIISPDHALATITALTLSVRLVGAAIGYAVYFNTFQNKLAEVLPTLVAEAVVAAGASPDQIPAIVYAAATTNTTALQAFPPAIQAAAGGAVLESYVQGFRLVYLVSIAFGVVAVITALFLGDIRKYMTNHVAVDIH